MNIQQLAKKIKDSIGGDLYFVGGFVRDQFMNIPSKDIDCELYGATQEDFINFLVKSNISFEMDQNGKFPVYRLKLDGEDIEIGFPRKDNKTGKKHTDFEVEIDPFMSFKDAARRRDFTCNAILQNVLTGEFIDPFGGIEDIRKKILRPTDEKTFAEDALRFFRAFQFVARFGFDATPVTNLLKKVV